MIVGFMRNFINPTYMARLTAMLCQYHGMDLIYLRPRDINMDNYMVNGKMLKNDTWINVEMKLPSFIDISPFCINEKSKEVIQFLRENTFLSDDGKNVLNKEKLQEELLKDTEFADLVIPTHRVIDSAACIDEYLHKYSTIVLKPINGMQGNGVYIVKKEKDHYILGYRTDQKKLAYPDMIAFFDSCIRTRGYIVQKYITSRTMQGHPFDCRIHAEKDGNGKWVSAKNYFRVGVGQQVISNVNQGGGVSDIKSFLQANFGQQAEEIQSKINSLSKKLPYKIEELRNTHIMSLGIDAGIDQNGELYLFEINRAPATATIKADVAMLRVDYYKFVLDNIVKQGKPLDYYTVLQEQKRYKEKYFSLQNSTSWRITRPIRFLGGLVKEISKYKK